MKQAMAIATITAPATAKFGDFCIPAGKLAGDIYLEGMPPEAQWEGDGPMTRSRVAPDWMSS